MKELLELVLDSLQLVLSISGIELLSGLFTWLLDGIFLIWALAEYIKNIC